jgi:hypothetical protein
MEFLGRNEDVRLKVGEELIMEEVYKKGKNNYSKAYKTFGLGNTLLKTSIEL